MRSQLISSLVGRGTLVPKYFISDKSLISESVKGQVQALPSLSRPVKLNVKTTRYVRESWAFSSLWQVWTGICHRYGFQLLMCPMFVQGNSLWIAHSVQTQNDLIHCCWGPLGYIVLSRSGTFSYCTYSFIPHPPCSLHPEAFFRCDNLCTHSCRFSGANQSISLSISLTFVWATRLESELEYC